MVETVLTLSQVVASVAETSGLKHKQVKGVIDALFGVAAKETKKNGNIKLASMLNFKLKKKPATPAKKGINPFTKELCTYSRQTSARSRSQALVCCQLPGCLDGLGLLGGNLVVHLRRVH